MRRDLISIGVNAQKMGEPKMSGAEILDHFANLLSSAEASLPSLLQVQRLSQAPCDAAELDSLRSTYEGEPAVFSATWVPSWTDALRTSSVLEGLKRLLSGIVQVDAFQLQYEACKDQECKVTFQKGTCDVSSFCSCEQSSTTDDPSKSLCILQSLGEREDTHKFNSNKFLNGGLLRYFNSDKQHDNNSILGNPFDRNLTGTDDMCVENNTVTRLYHPIASSSSEVIDFGDFISKLNSALFHPRDQLWYLTWRGIPASLESSLVPTEFDFFIRSLLHPTTSPDFIAEDAIVQRNLWVGAIVTSRIHFDALDNVHVCISGKKLFHLYPPSALPYLYPKPWREGALNNFSLMESILLANRMQHAKFFQNVKCWHAEVKAGEAIFIPAGWWHEVFTFEETVSANVWFKPDQVTRFRATLMHLKSENYYKFMLQRMEREPHI